MARDVKAAQALMAELEKAILDAEAKEKASVDASRVSSMAADAYANANGKVKEIQEKLLAVLGKQS